VIRVRQEDAVLTGSALVLALALLVPFVALTAQLAEALRAGAPAVSEVASAGRLGGLLATSLLRAAVVTAAALAVGVPLGLLVARTDVPGRRVAFALHVLPGVVPPYLLALGWFQLFGRAGLLGSETSARWLFGEAGAVAVLALAFAPLATALTALGAWGMDAALEESARVVAPVGRVLRRIVLPAALPGVSLAALLIFALAQSELGVPMFLRVDAYAAAVFARLGGIDPSPGEAGLLVLPLLAVALVLLALERRLVASRDFTVVGLRGAGRAPLPLGRWRPAGAFACGLAAVLSAAPLAALGIRALRDGGFAQLSDWVGGSMATSLVTSAVASGVIVAAGLPLAHALVRRRLSARLVDAVAVLAFVCPAGALAVGLLEAWNRPAGRLVYGSLAIVVLGFVARYAAVGTRACASVLAQGSPRLEESAAVLGAGYVRRLARILAPLHARGLVGAWLIAFLFCLRDLESAILVYPPGRDPLTVRIFTLEANGPEAVVAALACVQVALAAFVLAALAGLARVGASR